MLNIRGMSIVENFLMGVNRFGQGLFSGHAVTASMLFHFGINECGVERTLLSSLQLVLTEPLQISERRSLSLLAPVVLPRARLIRLLCPYTSNGIKSGRPHSLSFLSRSNVYVLTLMFKASKEIVFLTL